MKSPDSARVRAARGYESKDAGERGVVLRGNEDRDGQPALAHPGRSPVRQTAACGAAGNARDAGPAGRVAVNPVGPSVEKEFNDGNA
jgi:hypothetical protein